MALSCTAASLGAVKSMLLVAYLRELAGEHCGLDSSSEGCCTG